MINLLPPELRRQLHYARLNAKLLGYLRLLTGVTLILALTFGATLWYLKVQHDAAKQSVADAKAQVASYASFQAQATSVSERLRAIKQLGDSQTRFSALLDDLAKVTPQGVSLNGITLTGDATKPVRLNISSTTYDGALAFRNAIILSPRILGADVESITPSNTSGFDATVTIGFKAGAAK